MDSESEADTEKTDAVNEEVFSEQAIEEAYSQALKASEEAGISTPAEADYSDEIEWLEEEQNPNEDLQTPVDREQDTEFVSRAEFTPEQIIESLLFVGGEKLTAKKISGLLGAHSKEELVHEWIDYINKKYAKQNRAYEIQLGEEGYQFVLKEEFQTQRNLVFGFGPKEVRLSQDALEVLSFVAYKQPVTKKQLEEIDQKNVQASLRQLIRRELVEVNRNEDSEETEYQTTPRFLRLFGLNTLQDLPRAEELAFK